MVRNAGAVVAELIAAYEAGKQTYDFATSFFKRSKPQRSRSFNPKRRRVTKGPRPRAVYKRRVPHFAPKKSAFSRVFGRKKPGFYGPEAPPVPTQAWIENTKASVADVEKQTWKVRNYRGPMPRYRRRTARRKMPYRRGRKRRSSYRRRRSSYRRYKRPRMKLLLHPGGWPKTHTLKLRTFVQGHIQSTAGGWNYITFEPAQISDPFRHSGDAAAGNAATPANTSGWGSVNHLKAGWYDKVTTTAVALTKQPFGYDQWEATPYTSYQVLGAKITVQLAKGTFDDSAGENMMVGFTKLYPEALQHNMETFGVKYATISASEVSDMINAKIIKRPSVISSAGHRARLGKKFVATYSYQKWRRKIHGQGLNPATDSEALFGSVPDENPVILFVVADVAAASGTVKLSCFFTIDQTVRLSGWTIPDQSVV